VKLKKDFFERDALVVAKDLLGKKIVRILPDGKIIEDIITETEAYRGEDDLACHASKGKTERTKAMYRPGGVVYVYLIYGTYWLLNVVTSKKNIPQAVLIRSLKNVEGPGRTGRFLQLDKSFYGEDLLISSRIFLEDTGLKNFRISRLSRIGVNYAGTWAKKKWRFKMI